jgi:hypothetical protein
MANITTYNTVTTDLLLANMATYKSNPALVQQNILDYLQGITNGQVDIIDPTNPFVFLLEASVVNSAAAVQESVVVTQRLYPPLSRTTNDIYLHMSNSDYIDIFSTPAIGTFSFLINKTDFINNAVPVIGTNYSKVTIPTNSYITVAGYTFTLLYPIDILYYNNGSSLVQYDITHANPLQSIGSYIIPHSNISDANGTEWLTFNADINQLIINSSEYPLTMSEYFQQTISYTNLFYYCRVFYLVDPTAEFVEIGTTYTDQIFNPNIPTALIQVLDNTIVVNIPQIYVDNGLISGSIRIDVYTTLGEIDVNLANYSVGAFTGVFTAINPNELNEYTTAMNLVPYLWYSANIVAGGVNGIPFPTLQNNIINNALNGRILPITDAQISANVAYQGFQLVKNIDLVTMRSFKAIQAPPPSNNPFQIPNLNTSVLSLTINTQDLSADNKVSVFGKTIVITPETIIVNSSGSLSLLTLSERNVLNALSSSALVNQFNQSKYLYTPFYYMINNDTANLITRAYWMNNPQMSGLNYISNNTTTGHSVSTNSFTIVKVKTGYVVTLVVNADAAYLALNANQVFCQLAFMPYGQNQYSYMTANAQSTKATNGGFIFIFDIVTNFYFDINNTIDLGSFKIPTSLDSVVRSPLSPTINILYGINQKPMGYNADSVQNNIFNSSYTSANAVVITNETININFGQYLNNLWMKSSLYQTPGSYLTYQNSVPLIYTEPVFQQDPINGAIFTIDPSNGNEITYNVLHNVGDPVLDSNGNQVYAFYQGDNVLDVNGNPILVGSSNVAYTLDIVFYDGTFRISTDVATNDYVQLATNSMAQWATTEMDTISQELLEQTSIYYSPTNSNLLIECNADGLTSVMLNSNLAPTINIYLDNQNFGNINLRNQLSISAITILRNYLSNSTLNKTELLDLLSAGLFNIITVSVKGFMYGYDTVSIVNPQDTFIIERINYLESTGVIGVKENVNVLFYNVAAQN